MYDDVPPQIIETQRSPPILNPTTEQQKLMGKVDHEMETSHLVENAKLMGFEMDDIRQAVMRNFEENGESFSSFRSLVDAILDDNSASLLEEERIGSTSVADADLRSIASGRSGAQYQGSAHPSSSEVIRRLEDSRVCRMCHTVVADIVLMPCGHLVCCSNCCHIITKCPLCESEIQKAIKTYSA
uniref:RING-type domain-containing protein n=1 Tax=Ciona savignyi TaxID=51511 RepID=H2YP65_CIOSA